MLQERRDFEDHVQCQLEAGKRNLAESLSRLQAELINSRRQHTADQGLCSFWPVPIRNIYVYSFFLSFHRIVIVWIN